MKKEESKEIFSEYISDIVDVQVRKILRKSMELIPSYFWIAPSSFSGKYHPQDEYMEGGLVVHALKVFKLCKHLAVMGDIVENKKSILLASALLHDTFRSGFVGRELKDDSGKLLTDSFHPIYPFWGLNEAIELEPEIGNKILKIISQHMGIWSPFKLEVTEEEKKLGNLLHIADYLASRKDIGIEGKWKKKK